MRGEEVEIVVLMPDQAQLMRDGVPYFIRHTMRINDGQSYLDIVFQIVLFPFRPVSLANLEGDIVRKFIVRSKGKHNLSRCELVTLPSDLDYFETNRQRFILF